MQQKKRLDIYDTNMHKPTQEINQQASPHSIHFYSVQNLGVFFTDTKTAFIKCQTALHNSFPALWNVTIVSMCAKTKKYAEVLIFLASE